MTPLAQALLAIALSHSRPGGSPYSKQLLPECGRSPDAPTCALRPVCEQRWFGCRAPRWSSSRSGWVRVESRKAAVARYAGIAESIARTAKRLKSCEAPCRPIYWPGDTRSLAIATLTVVKHESGFREDIQGGYGPLGRGSRGESCLMQVMPDQAVRQAVWLSEDARAKIAKSRVAREAFAKSLLGTKPAALDRCIEVGVRMLAESRKSCSKSSANWAYGMYSMYGTGTTCSSAAVGNSRSKTFQTFRTAKKQLSKETRDLLGLKHDAKNGLR